MSIGDTEDRLWNLRVRYFSHFIAHAVCKFASKAAKDLRELPAAVLLAGNLFPHDIYGEWIVHGPNSLMAAAAILDGHAEKHRLEIQQCIADATNLQAELEQLIARQTARRRRRRRTRLARRSEQ